MGTATISPEGGGKSDTIPFEMMVNPQGQIVRYNIATCRRPDTEAELGEMVVPYPSAEAQRDAMLQTARKQGFVPYAKDDPECEALIQRRRAGHAKWMERHKGAGRRRLEAEHKAAQSVAEAQLAATQAAAESNSQMAAVLGALADKLGVGKRRGAEG